MVAVALAVVLALAPPGDVIDRILAVVGTRPITLSEVAAARQLELVEVPAGTADPTGYVLDRLIDRTLMITEVDRFQPPEPSAEEIAVRLDRMQARAGSTEAFDRALAVTGTSREQLGRFVRDSLRMQIYLNQRFGTLLDPVEREEAIAGWVNELRRRAQIVLLHRPAPPKAGGADQGVLTFRMRSSGPGCCGENVKRATSSV